MASAASGGVSPATCTLPPRIRVNVPASVTRALCSRSAASRTFTWSRSPGPMVRLSVCAPQPATQQNRNNNDLSVRIMPSSLLVLIFLAAVVAVIAVVCGGTAGDKVEQYPNRRPGLILAMHKQELVSALQGRPGGEANASQQNSSVCQLFQKLRIRHRQNRRRVHHDEIEFRSPLVHKGMHRSEERRVGKEC